MQTPSNIEYMILGYAATGIIMALTIAYFILRRAVCAKRLSYSSALRTIKSGDG